MPDSEKSQKSGLDYKEMLKPAPSWATGLTKFNSALTFIGGVGTMAMGVVFIISGRKLGKDVNKAFDGHADWFEKITKRLASLGGVAISAMGAITTTFGVASWISAEGARKAREFVSSVDTAQAISDAKEDYTKMGKRLEQISDKLNDKQAGKA